MPRPDKVAEVQEITTRFNEADAALLTEYRGLRVPEIAEVRNALRESDADYKVLKNTLTRLAVREVGLEELAEMLEGPTAIAFIRGDAVAAAKALDEAAKKYPVLVVKGGVMRGRILSADDARALAQVAPRETQLATIVMMAASPLQQTVNVFSALLRDLGSMLGQVVQKREQETPQGGGEESGASDDGSAAAPTDTQDASAESADPAPAETPPAPEAQADEQAAPTDTDENEQE